MRYKILCEPEGFRWIEEEYGVVVSGIEEAVVELCGRGWRLSGGVSSLGTAHRAFCIQAMVKLDDEGEG